MTNAKPLPAVDFLKIPETGAPYLEGLKCKNCSAIYLGPRAVCSKCGGVEINVTAGMADAPGYSYPDYSKGR